MMSDREQLNQIQRQITCTDILEKHGVKWSGKGLIRCPFPDHEDKDPSFGLFENGRAFKCHGCGRGGNAFTLHHLLSNRSGKVSRETVNEMAAMAGIDNRGHKPLPKDHNGKTIHPTLESALKAACFGLKKQHHTLFTPVSHWVYEDTDRREVGRVYRFENSEGVKQYRPIHKADFNIEDGRSITGWQLKDPECGFPLYKLPELAAASDQPVFVVEGEKCADALIEIGLISTTSAHGARSAGKADWSVLKNRLVYIIPDNDPEDNKGERTGMVYAEKVAEALIKLKTKIRILELPDLAPKEDVFDFIAHEQASGNSTDEIKERLLLLAHEAVSFEPKQKKQESSRERVEREVVAKLNKDYAIMLQGGKLKIFKHRDSSFIEYGALKNFMASQICSWANGDGDVVREKEFNVWFYSSQARRYEDGIVFDPRPGNNNEKAYNMWKGWAVQPIQGGGCDRIIDHIKTIICNSDPVAFEWLMNWCAGLIQKPWLKPGTVPILQGKQGTGKGSFVQVLQKIAGQHSAQVINREHVTGRFNRMLADKILLFVDEAFFAGNREDAARLKGLITESRLVIEPKGIDSYEQENYLHIIFSTNERHAAHVELGDRRYSVFSVSDKYASENAISNSELAVQKNEYFERLHDEIDDGGVCSFFAYLNEWQLDERKLRTPFESEARHRQQALSLSSAEQWLSSTVSTGSFEITDRSRDDNMIDESSWHLNPHSETAFAQSHVWESYRQFCSGDHYAIHKRRHFIDILNEWGIREVGSRHCQLPDGNITPKKQRAVVFPALAELRMKLKNLQLDELEDAGVTTEISESHDLIDMDSFLDSNFDDILGDDLPF
jgi:hypothetical protein